MCLETGFPPPGAPDPPSSSLSFSLSGDTPHCPQFVTFLGGGLPIQVTDLGADFTALISLI